MAASEEELDPAHHGERVSRREVDVLDAGAGVLAGLREAAGLRAELVRETRVVVELGLAPFGVRQIQKLQRELDVPPAIRADEIQEEVAARLDRAVLVRRPLAEESAAQARGEPVLESRREPSVHEQRRGERHREPARPEARVGVAQVVIGEEPVFTCQRASKSIPQRRVAGPGTNAPVTSSISASTTPESPEKTSSLSRSSHQSAAAG